MQVYKKGFFLCLYHLIYCLSAFAGENSIKEDLWDGKQYVNNSDLQYQWATSYIQKFQLQGHEKILDIGCGDGRITAVIAHLLPNGFVLGIDKSDSMLEVAHALKNRIHLNNLDFTRRDATQMGFENEFDFIVSFSCFHWISDHFGALQSIEKALKPSGKAFLYFAADHGHDRIDHAINTVANSPKWAHYFTHFSNPCFLIKPLTFLTYAEEVGLQFKRVENIIVDEVFTNKEAFAAWMAGWLAHLKYLPKEFHQEFLEEIVDCYFKKHPVDVENKFHYIGYWVEVELYKAA